MNLNHGERIGHALALGIDSQDWYKCKNYSIVLPKQDYLDNICWLLNKIEEYGIMVTPKARYYFESQFQQYFEYIYGSKDKDLYNINYRDYSNAWLLRGDTPDLYETGEYKPSIAITFWERCRKNEGVDDRIRNNPINSNLYYRYHYNFGVRQRGMETEAIEVKEDYVTAVGMVQKELQKVIKRKGIGIETNPSSNYLIGTFKRYEKHPIVNFYNLGLTNDSQELEQCNQLFVSINTDDQGTFGTYLENEYALMAVALEKVKKEDGTNKYNTEMIYEWLNKIRQMGLQQSFYDKVDFD